MARVALITGAASGIGAATAQRFHEDGWEVLLVDRSKPLLKPGPSVEHVLGDLTSPGVNQAAVEHALMRFSRLDAVVANAGVTLAKDLEQTTEAELETVLSVNVKAVFYLAQAVREPLAQTRGSLTVVASKVGLVAQRGSPAYVASKGAAIQLARALALDWAPKGIRVNAVCPGIVDTPMLNAFLAAQADPAAARRESTAAQPLGRLASPEECADAIHFLASPRASFITGVALPVDGGFTAQ